MLTGRWHQGYCTNICRSLTFCFCTDLSGSYRHHHQSMSTTPVKITPLVLLRVSVTYILTCCQRNEAGRKAVKWYTDTLTNVNWVPPLQPPQPALFFTPYILLIQKNKTSTLWNSLYPLLSLKYFNNLIYILLLYSKSMRLFEQLCSSRKLSGYLANNKKIVGLIQTWSLGGISLGIWR